MKYRYITQYASALTDKVNTFDLLSANALGKATYAIRITIPNDMTLERKTSGISHTNDKRTLKELNGVPVVKINGKWQSKGAIIQELATLPSHLWANRLQTRGYYSTKNGYLNKTSYEFYLKFLTA